MVTEQDALNWKSYVRRKRELTEYGLEHGYIKKFDEELISNLRKFYYNGVPLSILLLCYDFCNGNCYEASFLFTLAFDGEDFNVVVAGINDIRLNPLYIEQFRGNNDNYDNHCFVEKTMKDGSTWVYDVTIGLMYEKNFYYMMQEPRIVSISDKNKIFAYPGYNDIKNSRIAKNDLVMLYILPMLEKTINSDKEMYKDELLRELDIFKRDLEKIGNVRIKSLKNNNDTSM